MLSVAFFVDEVHLAVHGQLCRPAVAFRLPGYPSVLVRCSRRPSDPSDCPQTIRFLHGKSCLLPWVEGGPDLQLEMYLVDLIEEPTNRAPQLAARPSQGSAGSGVLLGSAVHQMHLRHHKPDAFTHVRAHVRDLVGNTIATLHGRCRAQRLGATMIPCVPRSRTPDLWLVMLLYCLTACAPATDQEIWGSRLASTDTCFKTCRR